MVVVDESSGIVFPPLSNGFFDALIVQAHHLWTETRNNLP
jgi:hypothetical protein